jgi:LEA14-like dessication related protein
MAAKKWLTALFGAVAVYWVYSKYRFSKGFSFVISRIGVGGSILDPKINVDVLVSNPTNVTTEFSNLRSELFLASGQKIADVYYNQKTIIKANSKVNVPLTAVTTLENAIVSINELIKSKKADFRLTGTAQVDGMTLPFDIKYTFNGF